MERLELPIFEVEGALLSAAANGGRRMILQAPTGSGKSTQIPQILLDNGLVPDGRQVIVLQPRRLAARMLACRVAAERGSAVGGEVGYQVRFEDRTSRATRILYVTEGILLRKLLVDPLLQSVAVLVFDEFHERHLFGDVTLARVLELQKTSRPDLTVVVMSATLDGAALQRYMAPCDVVQAEGRTFPVAISYLPKAVDFSRSPVWELAATEAVRLLRQAPAGDALVFMPGAYEIQRTIQVLARMPETRGMTILPLHGELPTADQDMAVAPAGRRKIIVSTNVAETSLTIEGIRLVVDSGLARVARFDPYRGIDTLWIERISQASADQRAGRAGRTAPGACVRLWTEREHHERPVRELPEIRRVDLAETLLMLKASGVMDVRAISWLEPPEGRLLQRAETLLEDLGALDGEGRITELGRKMLAFPLHPRYARMLLAAEPLGCVRSAALVAALTQERGVLVRRADAQVLEQRERRLGEEEVSDFFLLMRAWGVSREHDYDLEYCCSLGIHAGAARQVGRLFDIFCRIAAGEGLAMEPELVLGDALRRCILAGFADQVAKRMDGGTLRFNLVHGRRGVLERSSVVRKSEWVVATEVREVESGGGREMEVLLSCVTAIDPAWLGELFPGAIRGKQEVRLDETTRRVVARTGRYYHDLCLLLRVGGTPSEGDAARLLADEIQAGRCSLMHWTGEVEQWILRVNCLAGWCPELGLPVITAEDRRLMLEQICLGSLGVKEVKDAPVWPVVKGWLDGRAQSLVEKHAPERMTLPNGRKVRITYAERGAPVLAARIQDLYGVEESLRVGMGRQTVVIQVLAPNFRPVQVTSDLTTFWKEGYPKVKKELQRRYPKHEWR